MSHISSLDIVHRALELMEPTLRYAREVEEVERRKVAKARRDLAVAEAMFGVCLALFAAASILRLFVK
jgi:hypothetical protein